MVEIDTEVLFLLMGLLITIGYNTARQEFLRTCMKRLETKIQAQHESFFLYLDKNASSILGLAEAITKLNKAPIRDPEQ